MNIGSLYTSSPTQKTILEMSSVKSSKPPNEYEAFFDIDENAKKPSN